LLHGSPEPLALRGHVKTWPFLAPTLGARKETTCHSETSMQIWGAPSQERWWRPGAIYHLSSAARPQRWRMVTAGRSALP